MKNAGSGVNMKLIKGINHDVDNSPAYVLAMSSFFDKQNKLQGKDKFINNPYDIFNLVSRGSHRQHGHDAVSGMFIAMRNARALGLPASRGMLPMMAHLIGDSISNRLVGKFGTEGRDLFEALYSWQSRRNMSKTLF